MTKVHLFHDRPRHLERCLRHALPETEVVPLTSAEEFERALPEIEYLLALRPPRNRWQAAERLRLVQMAGVGVDSVLPAPDLAPEVALANARGVAASAMAQFALTLILAMEKGLPVA